jgi:hypothetical protein
MTKAERIKALRARLAQLEMKKADLPRPAVASPLPIGPMIAGMGMGMGGLPPIKIDLTVKAQNDPNQEQRVITRTAPAPG